MENLQEAQAPIDRRIVEHLISAIPEDWASAGMQVDRTGEGGDERVSVSISGPEGRGTVAAPDEMFEDIYRLIDCFDAYGSRTWTRVVYSIHRDEQGNWRYACEFAY
jgi:hypothetical protein